MSQGGVLVLSGPPCSGKSSVGRLLATDPELPLHHAVHIEVDALFALLLPQSDRNREDRMLAYDAAHLIARMLVERGRTVVLECTYARVEQRLSLVNAMADVPAAPLWVVELFVVPDVAVERFRHRHQATDLDHVRVRERAEAFPYFDQALRLTSSETAPADLAREVAAWLALRPPSVHRESWAGAGRGWD